MSEEIRRVPTIVAIDYDFEEGNPPNLVVTATGEVPTSGWSSPVLTRRNYIVPPADGIWEYDLYATLPTLGTIVTQVFTELESAQNIWESFEEANVQGVRVYGEDEGIIERQFN